MLRPTPKSPSKVRSGFTLIELMIVIVVIAILAALLVPAAGRAVRSTRIAGVVTEISQLESAIAKFKADHGIEPPSNITLCEAPGDWATYPNSQAIIRQIWPQFNFTKSRNLNNAGGTTDIITLTPSECLVLFLGGTYIVDGNGLFSMQGFSKDPTDPFAATSPGVAREAPLFEFQTGRLVDIETYSTATSTVVSGTNGIPEYKDALPSQKLPYLYYCCYDGQGYNESATAEFNSSSSLLLGTPYWQGTDFGSARWKASSHQIISPGYDAQYGIGGPYTASGSTHLQAGGNVNNVTLPTPLGSLPTLTQRGPEADNITNFSGGELGP